DRYLLPLLPILAVLAGAGLVESLRTFDGLVARRTIVLALAVALLLTPARYPTDTRPRDAAITQLAAHLNAKPLGAILYDHWLGWELGYYLGAWSDKRRVYYPEPGILASDGLLNPDPAPRYLIVPRAVDGDAWVTALRAAGFVVTLDYDDGRYVVYQVIPPWG
ncbi:MAG: hypothetical protein H7Y11_14400, partial [Armatimonadetes bacterium]|nr:hypothetical protein [Anaerolineae bacterium]